MPVAINNLTVTFADSTKPLTALGMNVKYVAAGNFSKLMDLKVDGQSRFFVDINGIPSSNISSTDLIARNYANASYSNAISANITSVAAFAKANSANITASSGYDRANLANITAISAFNRANLPNVTIANTTSGVLTQRASDVAIINYVTDTQNTGIEVSVTDYPSIDASNVTIKNYVVLASNVSMGTSNSYILADNTITRPYKKIVVYITDMSSSTQEIFWVWMSSSNGASKTGMNITSTSGLITDSLTGAVITMDNTASSANGIKFTVSTAITYGFTGTVISTWGNSLYRRIPGGSYINWLEITTANSTTSLFDNQNAFVTVIGYL